MDAAVGNPLFWDRLRLALGLSIVGVGAIVIGLVLNAVQGMNAFLAGVHQILLGFLVLMGLVLVIGGFALGSNFITLPLAFPRVYQVEPEGIGVESPAIGRRASTFVPWAGVEKVQRLKLRGEQLYVLFLVDHAKVLNPIAARRVAAHPGLILPGRVSRVGLTLDQWNSVKTKVPAKVLPP